MCSTRKSVLGSGWNYSGELDAYTRFLIILYTVCFLQFRIVYQGWNGTFCYQQLKVEQSNFFSLKIGVDFPELKVDTDIRQINVTRSSS